jgi:hypothetical protein
MPYLPHAALGRAKRARSDEQCSRCRLLKPRRRRDKKLTRDLRGKVGELFLSSNQRFQETEPHWFTHQGKVEKRIPIRLMRDRHLLNAIQYLAENRRRLHQLAQDEGGQFLALLQGELAVRISEAELRDLARLTDLEFLAEHTAYPHLVEEARKRSIPVVEAGSWYARGVPEAADLLQQP